MKKRLENLKEMILENINNAEFFVDYSDYVENCANQVVFNKIGCKNETQVQRLIESYITNQK